MSTGRAGLRVCRRSPCSAGAHAGSIGQRGVSLIEALVAIAIMAFGMLGLAGLQSSLRANADISKQRSEAVRLAQERLEDIRTFADLGGYAAIAPEAPASVPTANSNTEFTRSVDVTIAGGGGLAPRKQVAVTVSWVDRLNSDPPPSVTLSTVIAGVPPELQASLATPPSGSALQYPGGRHRAIPTQAKLLDRNISVFKPPQPAGSDTVAWVFDNTTALLKSCTVEAGKTTASLVASDLGESCLSARYDRQLLSGYVRFAASPVSLEQALRPTGQPLNLDMVLTLTSSGHNGDPACFDDAPTEQGEPALMSGVAVAYYCAIPRNEAGTWAGRSRIRPRGWLTPETSAWTIGSISGTDVHQVCRYTTMGTDGFVTNDGKTNRDHPLDYVATSPRAVANQALTHQNFLVIAAGSSCPAHTPTAEESLNGNTRLHQDGSTTYDNPT